MREKNFLWIWNEVFYSRDLSLDCNYVLQWAGFVNNLPLLAQSLTLLNWTQTLPCSHLLCLFGFLIKISVCGCVCVEWSSILAFMLYEACQGVYVSEAVQRMCVLCDSSVCLVSHHKSSHHCHQCSLRLHHTARRMGCNDRFHTETGWLHILS